MSPNASNSKTTVIGVGTLHRGDDVVGLEVARALRARGCTATVRELDGEPASLIEAWRDVHTAILIDATGPVRDRDDARAVPGRIHRFDATDAPLPAIHRGSSSTHGLGLADAVELARAMGQLPKRLIVFGIEGAAFEPGAPVTPAARAAVEGAVTAVRRELETIGVEARQAQGDR